MSAVTKTVSIREDQDEWVEKNAVSLSKVLQDALDERMKAAGVAIPEEQK